MSDVHPVCARFHKAIELIGAKWSGAVLQALFTGSHRFADIRAAIPAVSDVMLTRRLRELEDAGPVLDAVIGWSHKWIPVPASATDDAASRPAAGTAVEVAVAAHGHGRDAGEEAQ